MTADRKRREKTDIIKYRIEINMVVKIISQKTVVNIGCQ